ncbi:MAG TPA: hypothetical protein VIM16_22180 [Mucilaginibacter sp.]|jgi:hypothetical protein
MKILLTIICLLPFLYSCNSQPDSSADKKLAIGDTITDKKTDIADTTPVGLDGVVDSPKREIRSRTPELNIFEKLVGRWVFVKSFLGKGRSIDVPSFTIVRRNIESAGYAYFVHFSDDSQEYLLSKQDESTLTYGDYGYGTFEFDSSTGHLVVKISDISNAEYKKSNE